MLKKAYISGFQAALEKLGMGELGFPDGTAGANVAKSLDVKLTKSVDNNAGLSTADTNHAIGPKRASPKLTAPKAFMGMPK